MLHAGGKVTGAALWANLHFLFWLSLFPFAAGWMVAARVLWLEPDRRIEHALLERAA